MLSLQFKKYIGNAVFPTSSRMPLLEELTESVVLKRNKMDLEAITKLKNYSPPLLSSQIEASLCHEFGQHIRKTNWNEYKDPIAASEELQAAKLIGYTLSTISKCTAKLPDIKLPENIGQGNEKWVITECELLSEEIRTGDASRWENPEKLIGKRFKKFSNDQKNALLPAIKDVGSNPYLHPSVKRKVLNEITNVILATIK